MSLPVHDHAKILPIAKLVDLALPAVLHRELVLPQTNDAFLAMKIYFHLQVRYASSCDLPVEPYALAPRFGKVVQSDLVGPYVTPHALQVLPCATAHALQ